MIKEIISGDTAIRNPVKRQCKINNFNNISPQKTVFISMQSKNIVNPFNHRKWEYNDY